MFLHSRRLQYCGVAALLLFQTGCANVFRDFPDKGNRLYRIDRARSKLDAHKFSEVIEDLEPLIASEPKNPEIVYLAVCAYAGRAGLRILSLFTDIASGLSSKGLFEILAEHFVADPTFDLSTVTTAAGIDSVADIESAVTIIENYGSRAEDRNSDINYMAFFVYASRIGVVLNRYAYDPTTSVLRSNFRACKKGISPDGAQTGIPNDAVDLVMTSLPRVLETASYVFGSSSGLTDNLPDTLPFDPVCETTEGDTNCLATRTLIAVSKDEQSSAIGLGTGEALCAAVTP